MTHITSAIIDADFLPAVGLYDQVRECLAASGWGRLLTLSCDMDVEDTCEFLASITFEGCNED